MGLILKGLDDAVTHLHMGERVRLQFGGDLSFPNGKPSSPGKPRIPPRATVDYEVCPLICCSCIKYNTNMFSCDTQVELIDVPGKGEDYILDG